MGSTKSIAPKRGEELQSDGDESQALDASQVRSSAPGSLYGEEFREFVTNAGDNPELREPNLPGGSPSRALESQIEAQSQSSVNAGDSPRQELSLRFMAGSNSVTVHVSGSRPFRLGSMHDLSVLLGVERSLAERFEELAAAGSSQRNRFLLALNTAERQFLATKQLALVTDILRLEVASGFEDVGRAINFLEDSFGLEMAEVKLVLGQLDEKLATLVRLVAFPRDTEANELIVDGARALRGGYLDDAEHCLLEAIERKRTSYQGHLHLGFVYLNKEDADRAILEFRKAADYAPESESRAATVFALECMARTCFAAGRFVDALDAMEEARIYRSRTNTRSDRADYLYGVYLAQTGDEEAAVAQIVEICRRSPNFFMLAAVDSDLGCVRDSLLTNLEEMACQERQRVGELLRSILERLDQSAGQPFFEAEKFGQQISDARQRIGAIKVLLAEGGYAEFVTAGAAAKELGGHVEELCATIDARARALSSEVEELKEWTRLVSEVRGRLEIAASAISASEEQIRKNSEGLSEVPSSPISSWRAMVARFLSPVGRSDPTLVFGKPRPGRFEGESREHEAKWLSKMTSRLQWGEALVALRRLPELEQARRVAEELIAVASRGPELLLKLSRILASIDRISRDVSSERLRFDERVTRLDGAADRRGRASQRGAAACDQAMIRLHDLRLERDHIMRELGVD